MKPQIKNWLLGLGFDAKDGHVRITKGKNFCLYGGSKETHQVMQEKAIRVNEELDRRHKTLENVKLEEFREIAEKAGLKPIPPLKQTRR
jgi:hypothetical protein